MFGAALDDHLRYSNRKIALVLEVCCAALNELGALAEEVRRSSFLPVAIDTSTQGIFRLSGNKARVRKLRAAFDSGEIVRAPTALSMHSSVHTDSVNPVAPLDDIDRFAEIL